MEERNTKFFLREAGVERGDRGRLLGVERVRLRRDEFAVREVVGIGHPLNPPYLFADYTALDERGRHGGCHAEPGEDEGFFLRTKLLREKLVESRLLRRFFFQRGKFLDAELAGDRE